jgi:putative NIF3 family GTP cyclohydrolase 1 type 2
LKSLTPFLQEKGELIGLRAKFSRSRDDLIRRLRKVLRGPVKTFKRGPKNPKNVGIITGGAGGEIYRVAQENVDTFITGEAPHWAAVAAEELGINLLLGGHYATERFAVKALAAHLSDKYRLPYEFIDCPTGL